jgi:hypothetical protein
MADAPVVGRDIIRTAWAGNVVFAASSAPFALGVGAWEPIAVGVALFLFVVAIVVWVWAFAIAVARSARGDDIAVASLFFLQGSAPRSVKTPLFLALAVNLGLTAVFTASDPFVVLVPMLPIGLCGLWGARHGVYRARPGMAETEVSARQVRPERRSARGRAGE